MDTTKQQLSRESIRLMLMMRRLVRDEFGVTVPLSDDEAAAELLAFATRARNTLLHEMARELEALLTVAPSAALSSAPAAAPSLTSAAPAPSAASAAKPADVRRIYRGQVMG